jgi:hypothetical protein
LLDDLGAILRVETEDAAAAVGRARRSSYWRTSRLTRPRAGARTSRPGKKLTERLDRLRTTLAAHGIKVEHLRDTDKKRSRKVRLSCEA